MNQTLRNRLIAHKIAVDAIPSGAEDPFGAGVSFFASGKLRGAYRAAGEWIDEAWRVVQTAPDNPYSDVDAFMADLLAKIEVRNREQMRGKA